MLFNRQFIAFIEYALLANAIHMEYMKTLKTTLNISNI